MKYFWLCEKHHQDSQREPHNPAFAFACAIHPEMQEIDDMWHTFLLFTKDYAAFCNEYFGHFIHHNPNTDDAEISQIEFEKEFSLFAAYVYDHLGENTVRVWFAPLLQD